MTSLARIPAQKPTYPEHFERRPNPEVSHLPTTFQDTPLKLRCAGRGRPGRTAEDAARLLGVDNTVAVIPGPTPQTTDDQAKQWLYSSHVRRAVSVTAGLRRILVSWGCKAQEDQWWKP